MSDAELTAPDDGDQLDDETDTGGKNTPRPPGPYDQRIGAVVDTIMKAKNWEYPDFVREVRPAHPEERWNKNRIGRLVRGERRISVTELLDVIATLGVTREKFFADAGIIDLGDDRLEAELKVNPALDDVTRKAMLSLYREAREALNAD